MNKPKNLKKWNTIDSKLIFEVKPWLRLYKDKIRLPNNLIIDDYYSIDQDDHCVILAVDKNNEVLGLWQYKHGPGTVALGLPAGYINEDEDPLNAAKRELLEETGYAAKIWEKIGIFSVDGNRGFGKAHIFFAKEIYYDKKIDSDDIEDFELVKISIDQLTELLFNGSVATVGPAIAIAMGIIHHNSNYINQNVKN